MFCFLRCFCTWLVCATAAAVSNFFWGMLTPQSWINWRSFSVLCLPGGMFATCPDFFIPALSMTCPVMSLTHFMSNPCSKSVEARLFLIWTRWLSFEPPPLTGKTTCMVRDACCLFISYAISPIETLHLCFPPATIWIGYPERRGRNAIDKMYCKSSALMSPEMLPSHKILDSHLICTFWPVTVTIECKNARADATETASSICSGECGIREWFIPKHTAFPSGISLDVHSIPSTFNDVPGKRCFQNSTRKSTEMPFPQILTQNSKDDGSHMKVVVVCWNAAIQNQRSPCMCPSIGDSKMMRPLYHLLNTSIFPNRSNIGPLIPAIRSYSTILMFSGKAIKLSVCWKRHGRILRFGFSESSIRVGCKTKFNEEPSTKSFFSWISYLNWKYSRNSCLFNSVETQKEPSQFPMMDALMNGKKTCIGVISSSRSDAQSETGDACVFECSRATSGSLVRIPLIILSPSSPDQICPCFSLTLGISPNISSMLESFIWKSRDETQNLSSTKRVPFCPLNALTCNMENAHRCNERNTASVSGTSWLLSIIPSALLIANNAWGILIWFPRCSQDCWKSNGTNSFPQKTCMIAISSGWSSRATPFDGTKKCPKYPFLSKESLGKQCWWPYCDIIVGCFWSSPVQRWFQIAAPVAPRNCSFSPGGNKTHSFPRLWTRFSSFNCSKPGGISLKMAFNVAGVCLGTFGHGWNERPFTSGSLRLTARANHLILTAAPKSPESTIFVHATSYPHDLIMAMQNALWWCVAKPLTCSISKSFGLKILASMIVSGSNIPWILFKPGADCAPDQGWHGALIVIRSGCHNATDCHQCLRLTSPCKMMSPVCWSRICGVIGKCDSINNASWLLAKLTAAANSSSIATIWLGTACTRLKKLRAYDHPPKPPANVSRILNLSSCFLSIGIKMQCSSTIQWTGNSKQVSNPSKTFQSSILPSQITFGVDRSTTVNLSSPVLLSVKDGKLEAKYISKVPHSAVIGKPVITSHPFWLSCCTSSSKTLALDAIGLLDDIPYISNSSSNAASSLGGVNNAMATSAPHENGHQVNCVKVGPKHLWMLRPFWGDSRH